MATTGNPKVDAIVRERFAEAIGITRQMISEALPDIEPAILDKLCVSLPMAVFPSLARVISEGAMILNRDKDATQEPNTDEVQDHAPGRSRVEQDPRLPSG